MTARDDYGNLAHGIDHAEAWAEIDRLRAENLDLRAQLGASGRIHLPHQRSATCPSCGADNRFHVRPPCSLDAYDMDDWHRDFGARSEAR